MTAVLDPAAFAGRVAKLRHEVDQREARQSSLRDRLANLMADDLAGTAGRGNAKDQAGIRTQLREMDTELEAQRAALREADGLRQRAMARDAERCWQEADQARAALRGEHAAGIRAVEAVLAFLTAANDRLAAIEATDAERYEIQRRAATDGAAGNIRPTLPTGRLFGLEHHAASLRLAHEHLDRYRRDHLEA